MRTLFVSFLAALSVLLSAQQPTQGHITLTFGWVKQKDGTKKSVAGLVLPYSATTVEAVPFRPDAGRAKKSAWEKVVAGPKNPLGSALKGGPLPTAAEVQVYSTETTPSSFAYLDPQEFVDPSSLDDMTMTTQGAGKLWTKMRFGTHTEGTTRRIIIRFRVFDRQITAPPGQMDFTDEVADFGGYFTPVLNTPGQATLYEINNSNGAMSQAGVVLSDTTGYTAIQYRDDADPTGEGAFELFCYNVYQSATVPSIGSSINGWYYDADPLDGIYEDTEFDVFATQPPPYSNLLFSIFVETGSQQGTGLPTGVTTSYGFYQSGNFISLWFVDTNTYNVLESFLGSRTDPNIGVDVTGALPSSNPTSIRVLVDNTVVGQKSVQKVFMWRYAVSPGWVLLDTRNTNPGVPVSVSALYGGSIPLSQFVGPGGEAKVRITNDRDPLGSRASCINQVNRVNWLITY